MYHENCSPYWNHTQHGLRGWATLGQTKYASIFLPYIGGPSIISDSSNGASVLEDHSFQLVIMNNGYAIQEKPDTTERILLTSNINAQYQGDVRILDENTTGCILVHSKTKSKSEAILIYACLLGVGEHISLIRIEKDRPSQFITYRNTGLWPSEPKLDIEVVDSTEWYARQEAKAQVESPEALTIL